MEIKIMMIIFFISSLLHLMSVFLGCIQYHFDEAWETCVKFFLSQGIKVLFTFNARLDYTSFT